MDKMSSAAIIVTYNRLELLKGCLNAIENQSVLPSAIIVVNNNSTDNTSVFLDDWKKSLNSINKIVIHMSENTGGAGGFNIGIKEGINRNYDWLWIMDDDVVPDQDCLEKLLDAAKYLKQEDGYYSSLVFDEHRIATVNVPEIDYKSSMLNYPNWPYYLNKGIVKIKATTFVSLLVSRKSILNVGLPIKEYFIWCDDTEFTLRLNKSGFQGYLIGNSNVRHLRPGVQGLDIRKEENPRRIQLYRKYYRNYMHLNRNYKLIPQYKFIYQSLIRALSCLIKNKEPIKFWVIVSGLINGIMFNPKIEHASKKDK